MFTRSFLLALTLSSHFLLMGMKNKEIEYKIRLSISHEEFENKLKENKLAKRTGLKFQTDTYLQKEGIVITYNNYVVVPETFRIRQTTIGDDSKYSICYKKSADKKDQHSFREEYETSIGNQDILITFLSAFSRTIINSLTITKKRTTYLIDGLEIALDDVIDLGKFIEIEVKKEVSSKEEGFELIETFLKNCGIKEFTFFEESYYTMALNQLVYNIDHKFGVQKKLE